MKPARKPTTIPPEKRGRRGHKAVDDDPTLREWLKDQLQRRPAPTLDEMVDLARSTGFAVGRTAIWEFRVAFEAESARKELVLELSRIYNDSSKDGSVLDTETALAQLFSSRIYTTMLQKDALDEEALNLLDAFRKLQSSSSQRERTRFHVERGIKATTLRIRAEMQRILKKDPDTLRRVLAAIDQAAAEVRE
jgi:hypothetical protein